MTPTGSVSPAESDEARVGAPTDLVSRMLWATAAMGVSAGAVILLAAVRTKVVAVELGSTGVGSLALLISFAGFASVVAELGIGNSAVREIAVAQARHDADERDVFRRALRMSACVLALLGAAVTALAAGPIAREILGEPDLVDETRVSAVAIAAGVLAAAASGELRAFRRVRRLAGIAPVAGFISTAATLLAYAGGLSLLPVIIVAPPVSLAVLAWLSLRTLLPLRGRVQLNRVTFGAKRLVTLGVTFTLNACVAALGALVLRLLINRMLGTADTGQFQAAFVVASGSLSFLFAALATDYMPMLSGLADDTVRLNRTANTQLLVTLLVAAPGVMILITAAPTVVTLLYSTAFDETASLLRIMLLGDLLRLVVWTLGYILIARRARRLFVAGEVLYNSILIAATALLIPSLGLKATALAYAFSQVASCAWTLMFVRSVTGFRLGTTSIAHLNGLAAAVLVVYVLAVLGGLLQIAAWAMTAACTYMALRRLATMAGVSVSALLSGGLKGAIASARRYP